MANTIRFTPNGDYDVADSVAARSTLLADPTHSYQILYSSNGTTSRLILIDKATNTYQVLAADVSGADVDAKTDGINADFSGNTAAVGLSGGDRGDVLIGGRANDSLLGQSGDDVLEGGAGADYYDGGAGFDTVSFAHSTASVIVSKDDRGTYNQGDALGDTYYGIERFKGSAYDDEFYFMTDMIVEGGAGADRISAIGSTARVIVSYEHSAEGVSVNLSNNSVSGGDAEGDELGYVAGVIGSTHSDLLIAIRGTDTTIDGHGGLDTILGDSGNDTITVSGTWASVYGGAGSDRLVIETAPKSVTVALDHSVSAIEQTLIRGGGGVDLSQLTDMVGPIRIQGRGAEVTGTQAADRISGGGGRDTIAGDGGADTLFGGRGADTFRYAHASDLTGTGTERILDFSGHAGERDRIDLAALGITEIHKGVFHPDGTAQLRITAGTDGFSTLTFDFDGDGARDASLRVKSDAPLTAADFTFAAAPMIAALTLAVAGLGEHAAHAAGFEAVDAAAFGGEAHHGATLLAAFGGHVFAPDLP